MAPQQRNIIKSVCLGECKSNDLPIQLDLSGIAGRMNRLWLRSIQKIRYGAVTEFGATLVWERGRLRLTNIVQGNSGEVTLKSQIHKGQKFVGTFHTHPYEQGWQGIVFSGEDFASTINTNENVSIVHAGSCIAALVRTELSSYLVNSNEVINWTNALLLRYSYARFTEAVLKMNIDLCVIYKLAFYLGGRNGELTLRYRP